MVDNKESLLDQITDPSELRKLKVDQLPKVCNELRDFIIEVVSTNPGHFGASLGVVELTVALHYVFKTPYDLLVWDVGYQAYGHKILTGRKDVFGNVTSCISSRTINLRRIFSGKSPSSVCPTATISIHDNFSPG